MKRKGSNIASKMYVAGKTEMGVTHVVFDTKLAKVSRLCLEGSLFGYAHARIYDEYVYNKKQGAREGDGKRA